MPVSLVVPYRSTNTYALNVLIGAVQLRWPDEVVRVVLAPHTPDLVRAIQAEDASGYTVLVLWSFYSTHAPAVLREFNAIRGISSRWIHVAGGPHASAEPEQVLRSGFDHVFIGESEHSLPEFIERILLNGSREDVPGTACLKGETVHRNPAGPTVDLDDFPPFAPLLPRVNPIEITRGCVYACRFCQTPFLFKARFRHRSPEVVAHWADFMRAKGIRDIRFISPTALSYGSPDESVRLDAVENLLSSVRRRIDRDSRLFFGTFPSEIRPEHVSPAAVALIRKYCNNDNVLMGAQSGSDRILRAMHRGHDVESVRRAVRYCVEGGLRPNVDLIFGLPGETEEDGKATLTLAEELTGMGARIHGHSFMPLPGTPLRNNAPGEVTETQHLHKLIAHGKLYGQWQQQRQIAVTLANPGNGDRAIR